MIKHYINYEDNTYYVEVNDVIVMSVELDKALDQVVIRAPKEVYAGPVENITFSGDVAPKK